jgi:hypothetical protein
MSDDPAPVRPAGRGAAAVLSAAIGFFTLGALALAAHAFSSFARVLTFWSPTGRLSGVTDIAIMVWLVVWFVLYRRWAGSNPNLRRINLAAALLFVAGLLLTFPPFMDLLQGK